MMYLAAIEPFASKVEYFAKLPDAPAFTRMKGYSEGSLNISSIFLNVSRLNAR